MVQIIITFLVERQTIQSAAKQESAAPAAAPAQGSGPIMDVFKELEPHMNEEMVKKTNAVFAFSIKGNYILSFLFLLLTQTQIWFGECY